MALNLDTRQRAMLQEMGITVWLPKPAVAAAAVPASAPVHAVVQQAPVATSRTMSPAALPPATEVAAVATERASVPAPMAAPIAAPVTPAPVETATWRIAPVIQAFPQASGGHADDAWLVVWECPHPAAPLEGDSGKLLNNMLRALRLHHSPHVWIAGMQRPGHEALPVAGRPPAPVAWQELDQGLARTVEQIRPTRLLLLGLHPARAVLGSQEALGRLRAQVHQVHGVPAVVSYDPAYLLRSPHAKPAAWADLCRAHALRPPSRP